MRAAEISVQTIEAALGDTYEYPIDLAGWGVIVGEKELEHFQAVQSARKCSRISYPRRPERAPPANAERNWGLIP
jgi:hypothetical protein